MPDSKPADSAPSPIPQVAPTPDEEVAHLDVPAPPPPPPPRDEIPVKDIVATADDQGWESVLIVGPKGKDGRYPYVRVQPLDIVIGASVPTQAVDQRADVLSVLTINGWVTAPIDTYPPVTSGP